MENLMQQTSLFWLIVTIGMNAYIFFRWSDSGMINRFVKASYAFIVIFGFIILYHRVIMGFAI